MVLPLPPEPIGKVIILIRDYLAAHGDLTDSGSLDFTDAAVRGTEKHQGDTTPFIIVNRSAATDFPFGIGSGALGIADYTFTVRCYCPKEVDGELNASRLAGLVRGALHNLPPTVMGSVVIHRARVLGVGEPLRDPETQEPYVPLSIGLYAGALAPAS